MKNDWEKKHHRLIRFRLATIINKINDLMDFGLKPSDVDEVYKLRRQFEAIKEKYR